MTLNPFYNPSGTPATSSSGASSPMRAEFTAIAAGLALLPTLSGNGSKAVIVNAGGTALTVTTGQLALAGDFATTGAFNTTLAQTASVTLTLPAVSGTLATLAGTETLSNKTLVAPALGTPASGVLTNCTGTASGLTAGTVTTNANLTGAITSVGNATAVGSQTGTGSTFVMNTSPTLVTPNIGAATGTSLSVSGSLTSTVATGTAPLVVSSTTNVANLNASTLSGATFAAPGAIGGGTASTGAFTTLTATVTNSALNGTLGATTPAAATVTTLTATGAVALSPASANVVLSPTGTGVVTISPATAGTVNNVVTGGVTPLAGTFTALTATSLVDISGASAGQIKFPATQNASANANTLDDYEEGTCTPVVTFATPGNLAVAYSTQNGTYTKVGNVVVVTFQIITSSFVHTTASGNLRISGLPITSANNGVRGWCGGGNWQGITIAGLTDLAFFVEVASTFMENRMSGSGTASSAATTAEVASGGSIILRGQVTYLSD